MGNASPRRVLLKLSGESFCHAGERGISMDMTMHTARQIAQAQKSGAQMAVVTGGGNILRGAQFKSIAGEGIHEATAHQMGMLATVINGLARCVSGFALALGAGIIFIVAPSGAGARELIIVAALSGVMSQAQALAAAVVSRMVFTVADILLAGVAAASAVRLLRSAPADEGPAEPEL